MVTQRRKPTDAAYRIGREAFLNGKDRLSNPYTDKRTVAGYVTYSRAFRRAWWKGWDEAKLKEASL